MTLGEFCRRIGIDYDVLRGRMRRGAELFSPVSPSKKDIKDDRLIKGYSLDELVELYRGFAGSEDELQILADFACTNKKQAIRLLKIIKERIAEKQRG